MIVIKNKKQMQGKIPGRYPAERFQSAGPCSGFTLIEVLLALAIFSIGLLAVAGMQVSSVTKNTSSRMNSMAVEYASDYMERLLALGTTTDILDNDLDEDGDGDIDELDEVLSYPHLDAGGPHRPVDFTGTDHDSDGEIDIPVNQEFNTLFDLSWFVRDETSHADDFVGALDSPSENPVKWIILTVSWANGHKTLVFNSIKATGL